MRMLDPERKASVRNLQLYLWPEEAEELRKMLADLLEDPEAKDHFHLFSKDNTRELSFSLITEKKLRESSHYTELERQILNGEL